MYSGRLRMTGMSGFDTESLVQQMMKAESVRMDKLQQRNQLLLWKQDAYRSYASDFRSFQLKYFSFSSPDTNLNSDALFNAMHTKIKVAGADSNAISVRPGTGVVSGNHTLVVDQIAKGDKFVSGAPRVQTIDSSEAIDFDRLKEGDSVTLSLDGGREEKISFSRDDLDFINTVDPSITDENEIKAAKLANLEERLQNKIDTAFGFDPIESTETNKVSKINVSLKDVEEGKGLSFSATVGHSLTVKDSGNMRAIATTENALADDFDYSNLNGKYFNIKIGDADAAPIMIDGLRSGATASDAIKVINKKLEGTSVHASVDKDGKISFSNNSKNEPVTITDGSSDGLLNELGFADSVTLEANSSSIGIGIHGTNNNNLNTNKTLGELFNLDTSLNFSINGKEFRDIDANTTLKELMTSINDSTLNVTLSFDNKTGNFALASDRTGAGATINIQHLAVEGESPGTDHGQVLRDMFGFDAEATQKAQDAIFSLDGGAKTYRSENSFTVDGMGITLTNAAEGKTIDIELQKDTEKAYDAIVSFVNDYNELIDKLNTEVKQTRATSGRYSYYTPLTEDQKTNLSDKEIEKWETKAKEGILYRDDILSGALREMRQMITSGVYENGNDRYPVISMHDIGIAPSNRASEGGKLEIDTTKLKKALEERGDDVRKLFTNSAEAPKSDAKNYTRETGVAGRLDETIKNLAVGYNSKIGQRAGLVGTANEFDNVLHRQIKEQAARITNMQERLVKKEEQYYAMFARMEAAMMQADSQANYLTQMMGGGLS